MTLICANCLYPIDITDPAYELIWPDEVAILCPKCQSPVRGDFDEEELLERRRDFANKPAAEESPLI